MKARDARSGSSRDFFFWRRERWTRGLEVEGERAGLPRRMGDWARWEGGDWGFETVLPMLGELWAEIEGDWSRRPPAGMLSMAVCAIVLLPHPPSLVCPCLALPPKVYLAPVRYYFPPPPKTACEVVSTLIVCATVPADDAVWKRSLSEVTQQILAFCESPPDGSARFGSHLPPESAGLRRTTTRIVSVVR